MFILFYDLIWAEPDMGRANERQSILPKANDMFMVRSVLKNRIPYTPFCPYGGIAIVRVSRDSGTLCADVNHTSGKVIGPCRSKKRRALREFWLSEAQWGAIGPLLQCRIA
jgi:hypothetical protein